MVKILIVVWIGIVVFVLGYNLYMYIKSKNSPVLTEPATVLYKRKNFDRHGTSHFKHTTHTYYICFETVDGEKLTMRVNSNIFSQFSQGDSGNLTHQGNWYVDFVPTGK